MVKAVTCIICTHTKAADTLMFVYKAGVVMDEYAQLCLESCCGQGLPATMHVVQVSFVIGGGGGGGGGQSCSFNMYTCLKTHTHTPHTNIHT